MLYVGVEVEGPDAAERVNVYLPKSLLERIDWFSKASGMNRSGFFGLAARHYMGDPIASAAPNMHLEATPQAGVNAPAEPGFQRENAPDMRPRPTKHGLSW